MSASKPVVILGVFVADTAYRADRQPRMGETILGNSFKLGPGGKGSNQAVAAGKLGADITFLTRLGIDAFADMAKQTWKDAGVKSAVIDTPDSYTGAAYIFVEEGSGNNAIIVSPGAAMLISSADIEAHADLIRSAGVFVTQLEQPIDAALKALQIARGAGVTTILNPAPAATLPDSIYALCDYVTPNESEAEGLTGIAVSSVDDARRAADSLLAKGVGAVIVTLGEKGALLHTRERSDHVGAVSAGPVIETTGAGDAFNGGLAAALAKGVEPLEAVRFACTVAGISVTRPGTAPSMPTLQEVEALLARG
ncbi:ribokinase [Mesorhizobium sp. M1A.F.Ca.IN.020.06.1.1]|uniref:ribokinase n=3 Tax=Mesorhizobium TaxID=68287 RepID=UPI000BB0AFA7|nr:MULTISPECIES: ribokinase [unclassified Mesorhizobium]PBB30952.1 ribokinase [Mesorhizobium sp. WSM3882]RUV05964.1 ribokinase [Mesorhizobium sp. M1A.F.Ca.IN.020.03.2.1]RUV82889.1 ribokinase [Mesorhizobium sp. M1A.F.Ca.IN.020.32.1.1]RUW04504.1 ribokinase [Mesorhizobium sp. M1A.F.Ca.IN.022.05.2.1]RUW17758.1 ribokinase [Mesorhizobium sp. M1A.F.Ca.IN.020.06.1.1]